MVTRREALEKLAAGGGDSQGSPGAEAKRPAEEEGDLVGRLLLGTEDTTQERRRRVDEPDPVPTRVKAPNTEKSSKAPSTRKTSRATAPERDLAAIGDELEEKIAVIFGLAAGVAPVTSTYAVENSPKAIHALLEIAKRRPAVLRALTTVADGANALEIGKFVLGILVCIQVDTGRLKGDEIQARAFGVTDVISRHFIDNEGIIPTVDLNPNVTEQEVPGALRQQLRFQPI